MGFIYHTTKTPDLWNYEPEYNPDGTEKHITCNGARFHVMSWDTQGVKCSEPNCELNKGRKGTAGDIRQTEEARCSAQKTASLV